jgi:hypothetical protein
VYGHCPKLDTPVGLQLDGLTAAEAVTYSVEANPQKCITLKGGEKVLHTIWARKKIKELERKLQRQPSEEIKSAIVALSIE